MSIFSKEKLRSYKSQREPVKEHTIMLVDDEAPNLRILNALFKDQYHIIEARDGQEAYEYIQECDQPEKISLIISDQRMPGLNGTEFFEKIIPIIPETQRIILTGYTDMNAVLDAINRVHIYKFVLKPFDHKELSMTVERALESFDMKRKLKEYHLSLEARIKARTQELELKNEKLQKAQRQLVMQEKMASMGTLAAGIAHEIKNPLNFINNFSGLSMSLAAEIRKKIEPLQGCMDQETWAEVMEDLESLATNSERIHRHGQRANSVVSNVLTMAMGQVVEPQDIQLNPLVDEFVEIAWSGKATKGDLSRFKLIKNLDPNLGKVRAVPQNLGRVLINLVNNALEALALRVKQEPDHKPELTISTRDGEHHVEIRIKDNGPGISLEHKDRIFDHFFTTNPPGSGNIGLGLSISYEIIVDEHGGTFQVDSKENQYTEFVITLPKDVVDEQENT